MGIHVEGLQRVLRANGKARVKDSINIAEGLLACANILLNKSKELVPVDTGDLKASGHVEGKGAGFGATATVIYDKDYAVPVHEILDAYHEPPTQARYLADAVPKVRGTMTAKLQRQLRVGLK